MEARELFSPHAPIRGENKDSYPSVLWWDGNKTASRVIWYGKSKREYRLTGFQRGFPHLTTLGIGSLFVLVPTSELLDSFEAFIVDLDEDIDQLFEALGVEVIRPWGGVYRSSAPVVLENEDECVAVSLRKFASQIKAFPDTATMSEATAKIINGCYPDFASWTADKQLLELHQREYELFRLVEQIFFGKEIRDKVFATVDDFLSAARPLQNRRMSRAGRALENHVGTLFRHAGIPFDVRSDIKGRPDVVIPSTAAYRDGKFPDEKLFVVGIKTSCKERWRQILEEAPRVKRRYLLTLQQGVSENQIDLMTQAGITLVVPKPYHTRYPRNCRSRLLTIEGFISLVRKTV